MAIIGNGDGRCDGCIGGNGILNAVAAAVAVEAVVEAVVAAAATMMAAAMVEAREIMAAMAARAMELVTTPVTTEMMVKAIAAVHWRLKQGLWCWQHGNKDNNNNNTTTTQKPTQLKHGNRGSLCCPDRQFHCYSCSFMVDCYIPQILPLLLL
jgi:hypothetical protein